MNEKQTEKKSVLIMMAVYNGEKYLREQIESIISQDFSDWHLIIQDDASSDQTVKIAEEFCGRDERIELLHNEGRHGAYYNFHSLANICKTLPRYDYYMFADQDDIWKADKLRVLTGFISSRERRLGSAVPMLCYADMTIVDAQGNTIYPSMNALYKIDGRTRYNVFFSHKIFGCNIILNASLFFAVPKIDVSADEIQTLSHDNLYTKFAAVLGEVYYLPRVTMLFRRHGENTTKEQQYNVTLKRIIQRIFDLDALAEAHVNVYNQSLYAIKLLESVDLSEKQRKMLAEIKSVILRGGIPACGFVLRHKIKWGKPVENISRSLILFTGIYRKYLVY